MKNQLPLKNILSLIAIIILTTLICVFSIKGNSTQYKNSRLYKMNEYTYFHNKAKLLIEKKLENFFETKEINENTHIPRYSPLVYYIYVPFAYLSYDRGFMLVTISYTAVYLLSIALLILTFRRLHKYKFHILFFSLLFPPFILTVLHGHTSIIWLLILSLAFSLLKKDSPFLAGLTLSFFLFKPSLLLMISIIIIFSFRPRIFTGLLLGTLTLFIIGGIADSFYLWRQWFSIISNEASLYLNKDLLMLYEQNSKYHFFYPMFPGNKILSIIEYIFIMVGFLAIFAPIIYSYFNKKHFSRNSFWFILSIALVLANPYCYNYDLTILILPLMIFLNLLFADRVKNKIIILIIVIFPVSIIIFYILSQLIHIQLLAILLWFFLINGTMAIRIRSYMPKTFTGYWDDY